MLSPSSISACRSGSAGRRRGHGHDGGYFVCHDPNDWDELKEALERLKTSLGLNRKVGSASPSLPPSSRLQSPQSSPARTIRRSKSQQMLSPQEVDDESSPLIDSGDFLLALDNLTAHLGHQHRLLQTTQVQPLPSVDAYVASAMDVDEEATEELGHLAVPWKMRCLLRELHRNAGLTRREAESEVVPLLMEAKPHRSKWYDPHRLGQAELYDALERTIIELKAFHPHSDPFLQKVSKKLVPDYYSVIKRPMDLGTMHKKLKERLYLSKQNFVGDLQQIYDNCFQYNTDEDSPLRRSAFLLREKWLLLLQTVPEITILGNSSSASAQLNVDDDFVIDVDEDEEDEEHDDEDEAEDETAETAATTPSFSLAAASMSCESIRAFLRTLPPRQAGAMAKVQQLLGKRSASATESFPPEWDWLFFFNNCPDRRNFASSSSKSSAAVGSQAIEVFSHHDEQIGVAVLAVAAMGGSAAQSYHQFMAPGCRRALVCARADGGRRSGRPQGHVARFAIDDGS